MTDISLLPRDAVPRGRPPNWQRLVVGAVLLGGLGLAGWYAALGAIAYADLRSELAALQSERGQLGALKNLQREGEASEGRLQKLQELIRPYTGSVKLEQALKILNDSVPEGMMLTSYRADKGQVSIAGLSTSLSGVDYFIMSLEASGVYDSLTVRFPSGVVAGTNAAVAFPGESNGDVDISEPVIPFELQGVLRKGSE